MLSSDEEDEYSLGNTGGQYRPLKKSNKNCLDSDIIPINFTSNQITQPKRRRGKRAKEYKPNIDQINTKFRELWDFLNQNIMNSTQIGPTGRIRSDADNKKLIRRTRKFAMTLLNLFCTKNQRKGYSDEKNVWTL